MSKFSSLNTKFRRATLQTGTRYPKVVMWVCVLFTVLSLAAFSAVEVDTDPENMLSGDNPVRVLNEQLREEFRIHPTLAVGVVAPEGETVLTPERMAAFEGLRQDLFDLDGVMPEGIVSFASALSLVPADSSSDDSSGSLWNAQAGTVQIAGPEDVERVVEVVSENPFLADTVISADGTTLALFASLEEKGDAADVADVVEELIAADNRFSGLDAHIAGLPLAEEEFGQQMFIQMGIFAPAAGLLIFLLMLFFFRRLTLVSAAMIQAMLAVIWTMGLLVGTGNTVHIMSSMIPIFLMPIAILDSIHVLSEFFDRYPDIGDRRETLRKVYAELFKPIGFTSLTTAVAFAALALAPIPPVQVFGIFVAIGVGIAWLLTVMFLPAYVMLLNEEKLAAGLASVRERQTNEKKRGGLQGAMHGLCRFTTRYRRGVIAGFVVAVLVTLPGLTMIEVNDNPVRWFKSGTPIRVAVEELNEKLPGTFASSLILEAPDQDLLTQPEMLENITALQAMWKSLAPVGSANSYVDLVPPARHSDAALFLDEMGNVTAQGSDSPAAGFLGELITPDRMKANLRVMLVDGDNQSMREVVDRTEEHLAEHPFADGITSSWGGETYLNLVWQDEMVNGMRDAFLSTLLVVFGLMFLLFRSARWALLAMLPVTGTVAVIYGITGYIGKDYDMPMAILSTLVLGIGVDFAIHFVQRFRELLAETGEAGPALSAFFEEPSRALSRNALIVAIGFTPLFLSSLVPYLVVGVFLASIIVLSWFATLLFLPAVVGGRGIAKAEGDACEVSSGVPDKNGVGAGSRPGD